ncbi:MAG: diaminopimelate epimerase [Bacillota bacterium]
MTGTDLSQLAIRLSDRHFGIGGDGIILIMPSEVADFRMRMFNADGSEGKTCGNGLRCVSRYVYDHGLTDKTTFTIETLGGIAKPELILRDGAVEAVKIDMGEPRLSRSEIPMLGEDTPRVVGEPLDVGGCALRVTCVSMGNPHCVIFVNDVENVDVAGVGPFIEKHELFPEQTNVEFIEVLNDEEILFRVWERGSGVTLACGTGACAAVVASVLNGLTSRKVTVHLLGGDLLIEWGDDNHVYMTGPAVEVFQGEINL